MRPATPDAADRAAQLLLNAREAGWSGPDPYDGLWFRWPAPLTGGRRRRQALIQLHARAPIDIRRLYRRSHPRLAKAVALFGTTALNLHAVTGDDRHRETAVEALDIVDTDRRAGERAWGYPFDTQTRWSFYPADSPNVVVTAFAGFALLQGADQLEHAGWRERAHAAAAWVLDGLYLEGEAAFAYHEGSRAVIHNASLLGAKLVHRAGDPAGQRAVQDAVARTLAAQRPDGAWPYGEGPGLEFVDGFHTGYVLECLLAIAGTDGAAGTAIERGARYYQEHFFGPEGQARLWPDRDRPEDAHSAGTALRTLAALCDAGVGDEQLLARVTRRAVTHTVRDGHAVWRRWGRLRSTVRYLRWCDAHVADGLAVVAGRA